MSRPLATLPPSPEIGSGGEIKWGNVGIAGGRQETPHRVLCKVSVGMNRGTRGQFVTNGLVLLCWSMKYQSGNIAWISLQHDLR